MIDPGYLASAGAPVLEDFINGKVAMIVASTGDTERFRASGIPFGVTTVPPPAFYTGKPAFGLSAWLVGIGAGSRRQDDAISFLNFLYERKALIITAAGGIPEDSAAAEWAGGGMDYYSKFYDIYQAGDSVEEFPGTPDGDILDPIVREEILTMFRENRAPGETAQAIQRRWTALRATTVQ
jgi:spermidine/putrescine-binding protein